MIQTVVKGRGGTIWTEFIGGRPNSCTVDVFDGNGNQKVTAGAATPEAVTTVSTAAAADGATTIDLASVAGIVRGRRYRFDAEDVAVKSIAALVVTLWAPLGADHALGATFQGVRVEYQMTDIQADAYWADGYAVFTPDVGDPQTEALHCTKHKFPEVMMGAEDARKIIPKLSSSVSAELDLDAAYRDARDNFLIDLQGKAKVVHAYLGVAQFRRLVSMRFWLDRRFEFGEQWAPEFENLQEEYDRGLDDVPAVSPKDEDGDGATVSGPHKHALTGLDLETL